MRNNCATTVTTSTSEKKGFRHQAHVDAVYSAQHHFHVDRIRRAKIATGITMEYAWHEYLENASTTTDDVREEVRVVMVMGFSHTKEVWAPTIDTLLNQWQTVHGSNEKLKILSFDNRGVGGSTSPIGTYSTRTLAEDALALMDHVGWKQAHIVGLSMGGMVSLELAHMAPHRIQSLSLLVTTRGRYIPNFSGIIPMTRTLDTRDPPTETHNLLMVLYPPEFLISEMESDTRSLYEVMHECHMFLVENRESPRVLGIVGQSAAVLSHYVSDDRLRDIRDHQIPILLLSGAQDVIIPAQETRTLHRILAADHVHMVMYEDAGHGVFIQYLEEVAEDIIRTIRRGIARDR